MVLLFLLSMVGCILAEAPYIRPRKPEGALLLLTPEYNKKSEYYSQPFKSEAEDLGKISEKLMDRLRQKQESGTGSYHIYSNDGRFQNVQYTTAPLKSGQQYPGVQQHKQPESGELNPIIAQFGRLQQELQEQQIQQLKQRLQQLEQQQQELKQQQEELRSACYLASIRYTNVDSITSPIYSYKPFSVTRILRYAPQYY